ncbi:tetratricopeptide repeat protein [Bizionia gelidisalsuginis]|uniref:Tetratricopeptide repeat protein n=2 Tax=Bizionia TaxID=283785 RepID=A0A8H2LH97_9FLAO|nr:MULTISPECIES: tetratricopeptide repeat-containing sensor histidine kinase [Bizionia]TYB74480.1 tetratricopeptide repeat protein [Bizionia saleffrena]TYC16275.1 tetratricopeptide repeat protein [Bizionia gelidisalsuginis]
MKSFKKSFLFFLFISVLLVFKSGFGQQSVDSLTYYTKSIEVGQSEQSLPKAYRFFSKHFAIAKANDDVRAMVYDLCILAELDFKIGFYDASEATCVKGLALLDTQEISAYNSWFRKFFYNQLGQVYKEKQLYNQAFKKYYKALALANSSLDSLVAYNNIAIVLKHQNQFKEAENTLEKAVGLFVRVDDSLEIARVLDNLGVIKHQLKKTESFTYFKKALDIRKRSENVFSLYPSYKSLATYYLSINDSAQATKLALKAYNVAALTNSLTYKLDATKLRLRVGDYGIANEYMHLNDSLEDIKRSSQNKFALLKYNVSKSELQSEKEKNEKQVFQFIAVLVFVLGLSLFFIMKTKNTKDKLQQVYITETRISKKVHDEVANDVYQIMTKLQDKSRINETVLDDLEHIYNKTRDISKENSTIDFGLYFDELLSDLLLTYKSATVNVITRGVSAVRWQSVSEEKKMTAYRVLQELMTNMKKHSQASLVLLIFNQKDKKIEINYSDNGVGCKIKKQNGLQNAENRIQTINGTITFESEENNGFKAKIII